MNPYVIIGAVFAFCAWTFAAFSYGEHVKQADWDAAIAEAQVAGLKQQAHQQEGTATVLENHAEQVRIVEKRVPVIQRVVVEHCGVREPAAHPGPDVPGVPAEPDAGAGSAGPDRGFAEALSAVIEACDRDGAKHHALIGAVRANQQGQ